MSVDRRRFCVFCGKQPDEKNNEHVIPRWLIEMTGDPKRPIQVGPFVNQKEPVMRFAFDQFRFPACRNCNDAYASFEDRAKSIVEKLLRLDKASAQDFDCLLDWFDKVRIGLWLGYHQLLDKNFWQITPNFYIADRIGTTDRLLLIYRTNGVKTRVNFPGVDTPAFAHSPTCFCLAINNLYFINISADFLLARRAGLPYPKSIYFRADSMSLASTPFLSGTEKITYPVMGYNYNRQCAIVAQPIFKKFVESMADTYGREYIKNKTLTPGKFRPIVQRQAQVKLYPEKASLDWLPVDVHDENKMRLISVILTLQLQIEMLRRVRVWKGEDKATKRLMKHKTNLHIKANTEFISWIKDDMASSEN